MDRGAWRATVHAVERIRREVNMDADESPVRLCNFLQDKKASKCPSLGLNLGFLCSKP